VVRARATHALLRVRRLHDRTGKEGDAVACRWCAASTRFCDGAEAGMAAAIGAMSIRRQA
jgi:hypothetical protein